MSMCRDGIFVMRFVDSEFCSPIATDDFVEIVERVCSGTLCMISIKTTNAMVASAKRVSTARNRRLKLNVFSERPAIENGNN